ncbi:hypothetical protein [Hypericibacter sp.]|uniref:hypothetical protein n=1 Tax=Hypericibacter sp. TaxID=2705401 RepID=UPI003D6C71D5
MNDVPALKPVSFRQLRGHAPRLSQPHMPGRHSDRFWSDEEKQVLLDHYETHGAAFCAARLPRRNISTVYQTATKLGLKGAHMPEQRSRRPRGPEREALDERIQERWPELKGRGAVLALANELGVPRWWLSKQALRLGLAMPHVKEPPWTEAEKELLGRVPLHDPERAARIFREHGFPRSAAAIMNKCKRLKIARRYRETFSGTSAARVLGLDNKTVTLMCGAGEIKATRRPTKRLPQQGGDPWSIERADLRRFVIDNLEYVDFRKVDKFALVDLLTIAIDQPALEAMPSATPAATPIRRQSPWRCHRCRKLKRILRNARAA